MNEQQLDKYLLDVVKEILGTIQATDLTKAGTETVVLKKINNILTQFGRTIQDVLPREIVLKYFGGVDDATRAAIAAGAGIPATFALTPDGLISSKFRRVIHVKAVERLIDDAMLDIARAISTTRNSSAAAIATTVEKVRADMVKGMIVGDPQRVMQGKVMKTFLDEGLTAFRVIDKNGRARNLPLNFYAQTVTRSKVREATVQGSAMRYREIGQDLVKVHGNADSCGVCSPYVGMVFSLDGRTPGFVAATRLPPFHPSCRCGISSFDAGLSTPEELQEAYEMSEDFNPNKDKRSAADKKHYEDEQAGRRRANAELKQFARYQAALGAEAPKTLGAFRRMKRADTEQYKNLKSQYASYAQSNRLVGK